jgi:hypothetical protein
MRTVTFLAALALLTAGPAVAQEGDAMAFKHVFEIRIDDLADVDFPLKEHREPLALGWHLQILGQIPRPGPVEQIGEPLSEQLTGERERLVERCQPVRSVDGGVDAHAGLDRNRQQASTLSSAELPLSMFSSEVRQCMESLECESTRRPSVMVPIVDGLRFTS